jgi:tripartite-type tricarboxylate transporter receptor subunit TctC
LRGTTKLFELVCVLGIAVAATGAARAQVADEFYRGKTIRLLVGSEAGGGFSAYSLLLASAFGRFIPGQPNITVEYMPGAGGVNSINYIANAAPKDGTVIAVAMPNFFVTPYVQPGATRFDPKAFHFIGRMSDFGRVLATWDASGARSVDDLKKKAVTVGASSLQSTTSVAPVLMNEILGTKMNVIAGYMGSGPTLIALERGEVGALTVAWSTLKSERAEWLRDGKVSIIAGLDFNKVPLAGVPRVRDLINDPRQLAIWDFVALPAEFGTAFLTPPGVPEDRLRVLRTAFDQAMGSPELIADAAKRQLELGPKSGAELDTLFQKYGIPTPEIVTTVSRVMGVSK